MSYLHLPLLDLADISKGTISLWFRFSNDSVQKAIAYGDNYPRTDIGGNRPAIFKYTMPLVTFGRKVMANVYDFKVVTFTQPSFSGNPPLQFVTTNIVPVGEAPCEPSYIGIECGETPVLVMKFQSATRAQVQGLRAQISNVTWTVEPHGQSTFEMHQTIDDISYILVAEPELFLIKPKFKVDVDKWHHLLVSFDFSSRVDVVAFEGHAESEEDLREETIKSYGKIWFAFDDENKKGKDNIANNIDLADMHPAGWVSQDQNGIIPQNAEAAVLSYSKSSPALDSNGVPLDIDNTAESPEYHWEASPLPTQGGPMGLPASAEYVETVYHCEMAEFQFFAGVTLDTSIESNRRVFVGIDGKPVSPTEGATEDDPRGLAEKLLGKRPSVMFHKSGNWKIGKNTGSTGVEINTAGEETVLPAGQFKPTAKIEPYTPDPSLEAPTD